MSVKVAQCCNIELIGLYGMQMRYYHIVQLTRFRKYTHKILSMNRSVQLEMLFSLPDTSDDFVEILCTRLVICYAASRLVRFFKNRSIEILKFLNIYIKKELKSKNYIE